jgi:hypothetical protein
MAASQNRNFWENFEKSKNYCLKKADFFFKMSESTGQDGLGVLGLGAKFKKS